MKSRKYTDEQFIEAINSSTSVRAALTKLGLKPAGGNYKQLHANVSRLELGTSHFTGQAHLKGKANKWVPKKDLSEILVENSSHGNSNRLRQRLMRAGIFSHQCSSCKNTEWLGKPISLDLEHKNGINTDNRIENLCLLCPNCHAQTTTYRGKNIGRTRGI